MKHILRGRLMFALLSLCSLTVRQDPYVTYLTDEKIILDIHLSADEKSLYAADGKNIKCFSTDDQSVVAAFTGGHTNTIVSIDVSKDGKLLASAGKDSTILIWDIATKQIIKKLTHHKAIITALRFSPDSHMLFSGGTDHRVYSYDLNGNQPGDPFSDHTDDITSIDISPDNVLASASADGTINLYNTGTNKLIATIKDRNHWVRAISFNTHGDSLISCGDDGKVILWKVADLANIKKLSQKTISKSRIHAVTFLYNSSFFAIGALNGSVVIVTPAMDYEAKINVPVNKVILRKNSSGRFEVITATWGKGILQMDSRIMSVKKNKTQTTPI